MWQRQAHKNDVNGQAGYQSPRDDINAPDLYIPVMGFVTYMILEGISEGLRDK